MKELGKKQRLIIGTTEGKSVLIFLQSEFTLLTGDWYWPMQSEAVFCGDVMPALHMDFEATRCIFHPDDLFYVKEQLAKTTDFIAHIMFRVITTYGEVKTLEGTNIYLTKSIDASGDVKDVIREKSIEDQQLVKHSNHLQLAYETYKKEERNLDIGNWWHNSVTGETWYSDHVFSIYDLPAQSLNTHLHTFAPFIHPEEKEQVKELIETAYKRRLPLHFEFRIKTAVAEKNILYTSHWFFSEKGEPIFGGSLKNITEQKASEFRSEEKENLSGFYKQQLLLDEQQASIGHWQVNLVTRKTTYSDQYYRIYGLRQTVSGNSHSFTNHIHPDDREAVLLANKKMLLGHYLPEMDYRIIRSDGRIRYIHQQGKLVHLGNDILMAGTIQDVTTQKLMEKKIKELNEKETLLGLMQAQAEEIAGIVHWVWNLESEKIILSDGFHKLLGLKREILQVTHKQLLFYIHPDDQKKFSDELAILLQQKTVTSFDCRFVIKGSIRNMRTNMRIVKIANNEFLIGALQDVTSEYSLQHQLHHHLQLNETLTENILDRVLITDNNNTIIHWNNQCKEVYNIKKEDVIGKNFFDVFPKLKTEEQIRIFNMVLKGEKFQQPYNKSVFVPGYYTLLMLPFWNEESSEVKGIIHIIRDVTKEVELNQNLNERLNFISSLVDASVDRIIALDKQMNYQYWNTKAELYYGISKEVVIGKNILELFPGFIDDPSYSEFRKVLKGETVYIPADKNLQDEKGYFETYLIPIKEKGEVTGILWITHDLDKEYQLKKQ